MTDMTILEIILAICLIIVIIGDTISYFYNRKLMKQLENRLRDAEADFIRITAILSLHQELLARIERGKKDD